MSSHIKVSAAFLAPVVLALAAPVAEATILGISGTTTAETPSCPGRCFNLTAREGHIVLGDGNSLLTWGFSDQASGMQYPGPTLLVNQGEVVQVTLTNELPADRNMPVSIVFPGQEGVVATGGTAGLMTSEVATGAGSVTYRFIAGQAGTYVYQSGSQPELEIEMGLVGAMIVRPAGFVDGPEDQHVPSRTAYGSASTYYDTEYLFFLTEMDRKTHEAIEQGLPVDPAGYSATLWFVNGRNGPDTLLEPQVGWMPSQPYNALARMHVGDRVLMRVVGAGHDSHPFHHHGNNAWAIARDGRVLESGAGAGATQPDFFDLSGDLLPDFPAGGYTLPDRSYSDYTIQSNPGATVDAIFTWTGKGLNWDIYGDRAGHLPPVVDLTDCAALADGDPEDPATHCTLADAALGTPGHGAIDPASCDEAGLEPHEDPASHCKPIPVKLPEQQALTFGGLWSGSPYLGVLGTLPPGEGGLNPNGGYSYMWHSHTERELTNDDVFPGGMMTMMIVEAHDVPID